MRRKALAFSWIAISLITFAFLLLPIVAIFVHTSPGRVLDQL